LKGNLKGKKIEKGGELGTSKDLTVPEKRGLKIKDTPTLEGRYRVWDVEGTTLKGGGGHLSGGERMLLKTKKRSSRK